MLGMWSGILTPPGYWPWVAIAGGCLFLAIPFVAKHVHWT